MKLNLVLTLIGGILELQIVKVSLDTLMDSGEFRIQA